MLETIGLVAVPATAGQVSVAEPLVPPAPVMMQAVVLATPHCNAVVKVFDQMKLELPSAMEFVVPGSRAALTATPVRFERDVLAPLPPLPLP